MDFAAYQCEFSNNSWKEAFGRLHGLFGLENFLIIKNKSQFDLSSSTAFPLGIIYLNTNCFAIGYATDNTCTNWLDLEPWKSNPPKQNIYLWGSETGNMEIEFSLLIKMIKERLGYFKSPPGGITDIKYFEKSRLIFKAIVECSKCMDMAKLIEYEKKLMRAISNPDILRNCAQKYGIEETEEGLEKWIDNIYMNTTSNATNNSLENVLLEYKLADYLTAKLKDTNL